MPNYIIAQLDDIPAADCPCGQSRRAFVDNDNATASLHVVDIKKDARTHYHKETTETYLILEGEGQLELDGESIDVRPMTTALIKPLCRHRAVGSLKIAITCFPKFDPKDEFFD